MPAEEGNGSAYPPGKPKPTSPDAILAQKLALLGIVIPNELVASAREHAVNVALGASMLIQESGSANLWGHDPTIFIGGFDALHGHGYGEIVTEVAYKAYLEQRGPRGEGGMQGVGPMQLTFWSVQDEADALGGCWVSAFNLNVGLRIVANNIRESGLFAGVAAYNGSGSAADAYATEVIERARRFATALGVPEP